MPVPKLVVFYNGTDEEPDEKLLYLQDAFPENRRDAADIQVRVRMININKGRSSEVMATCKPLDEYAWMVDAVRMSEQTVGLEAAIDQAIDTMPDDFVIKQYIEAHRSEVKGMLLTEYNEAKQMELVKEEALAEGLAKRRTEGIVQTLVSLVKEGLLSKEEAARRSNLSPAEFEAAMAKA